MSSLTNTSKNNVSLTNTDLSGDILVDEAIMTVDEADRPVDNVGLPLTKISKNSVSLTNSSEGV